MAVEKHIQFSERRSAQLTLSYSRLAVAVNLDGIERYHAEKDPSVSDWLVIKHIPTTDTKGKCTRSQLPIGRILHDEHRSLLSIEGFVIAGIEGYELKEWDEEGRERTVCTIDTLFTEPIESTSPLANPQIMNGAILLSYLAHFG